MLSDEELFKIAHDALRSSLPEEWLTRPVLMVLARRERSVESIIDDEFTDEQREVFRQKVDQNPQYYPFTNNDDSGLWYLDASNGLPARLRETIVNGLKKAHDTDRLLIDQRDSEYRVCLFLCPPKGTDHMITSRLSYFIAIKEVENGGLDKVLYELATALDEYISEAPLLPPIHKGESSLLNFSC